MSDGQWTDQDSAEAFAEALPFTHPVRAVRAFIDALQSEDAPDAITVLESLVTPESREAWGDFGDARRFAADTWRISTLARRDEDAPDVAYVKFTADEGPWMHDGVANNAATWATLVWRPDISNWGPQACWRIHQLGSPVPASPLPRTTPGFDPSTA